MRDLSDDSVEVGVVPGRDCIWSRFIKHLCGALLGALLLHGQAVAADPGARAVVADLNAALLESMQSARELGYEGRYRLLEPVLRQSFDFPAMARIAVGSTWADLSASERERIVDLFAAMSVANFAARFAGFSGERFEIVAERAGPRDAVVIESEIRRPAEEPVGLDYVLRRTDGRWRIIDVLLDAKYSELARQRSEFAAVLSDGGLPDLIASLERKIRELSGEG